MIMTLIFLIITSLMIIYQRYREGNWVNLVSILMTPYVPLVFLNNIFVYKLGYYKISDDVLLMLLLAFVSFFVGTLPFKVNARNDREQDVVKLLEKYDINKLKKFIYFVGIVAFVKLILLYRSGRLFNFESESEGEMATGFVGHLLLICYSVFPIYFMQWVTKKKISTLLPILLIFLVTFCSFVKYHIIGLFLALFIFISIYRKTILKKSIFILVISAIVVFFANYAIGFAVSGNFDEVDNSFYLGHFWAYVSGSLIYDNYIFTSGIRVDISIFDKLLTYLFAFPNMFFEKLFSEALYTHKGLQMLPVGDFEFSNIVDAIGYLYPSRGDTADVLLFCIVEFLLGCICGYIYKKQRVNRETFNMSIVIFLTYFVSLSFYGPFYTLAAPWEMLIWASLIPCLFYKRKLFKSNKKPIYKSM